MAVKVLEISIGQKDQLLNRKLIQDKNCYFNPTIDADGKWFISHEERNQVDSKEGIDWIDSLVEIDYNPVIEEI